MGTYTSTWNVEIQWGEDLKDWQVDILRTSMESPIARVDGVPHASIAAVKGVPITSMKKLDGIQARDYKWQVTITA